MREQDKEYIQNMFDRVEGALTKDRNETHGPEIREVFAHVADLFTCHLMHVMTPRAERIGGPMIATPEDVLAFMQMIKTARQYQGIFNQDDHDDKIGYAALEAIIASERSFQLNTRVKADKALDEAKEKAKKKQQDGEKDNVVPLTPKKKGDE